MSILQPALQLFQGLPSGKLAIRTHIKEGEIEPIFSQLQVRKEDLDAEVCLA